MTLDESIERYTSNAEYERTHGNLQGYLEFRQLAEWLKELKQLRKQTRWIPVSERLPKDSELVLFSTKTDRVFEGRYFDDNTDRQWYAFRDETFAWNNVVIAWMPLPEPYKANKEREE